MQRLDDDERRRRLGVRHRLSSGTRDADVAAAAASVVALHGTDPASMFLAAWARTEDVGVAEVERALYDDRTIVRVLAMRRTVFGVPTGDVPVVLAGAADDVAREERRKLVGFLTAAGRTRPERWIDEVEQVALAHLREAGEMTSAELTALDERLASPVVIGAGTRNETTLKLASRLLLIMSAEGRVVRTRPRGSWTSTQFRWSTLDRWAPSAAVALDPAEAEAALARLWLARFGPALADDLTWWTRWTKTRTRRALTAAGVVEVDLDGAIGVALADDLQPTPPVEPWVALLPALDPTTMGWKARDWYLGDHGQALFDTTGNAGPTIWFDGRIVGGWVQQPSGDIATRLVDDIGADALASLDAQADLLSSRLGEIRLMARGRRPSPLEKELGSR